MATEIKTPWSVPARLERVTLADHARRTTMWERLCAWYDSVSFSAADFQTEDSF